ncbi:hypothetical protein AABB24_025268 [Solanum stoloniferum]|uniref:SPX domain-containing protein n=1 Tax=Solanum stoloniferum TaxID=62892 RepID=A0ABD2SS30_9SOLN
MKFGKEFTTHLEETLPEWRDKYLCYKPLKKLLKNLPLTDGGDNPPPHLQDWFVRILNEELDKFNDFYVDKEEEFIIRLQVYFLLRYSIHTNLSRSINQSKLILGPAI